MIIKICGITHIDDARDALAAGADWIGLNLVGGPRRIDLSAAVGILSQLDDPPRAVVLVAIENDELPPTTAAMLHTHAVRRLQLYGQVTPKAVRRLADGGFESILVTPAPLHASPGASGAECLGAQVRRRPKPPHSCVTPEARGINAAAQDRTHNDDWVAALERFLTEYREGRPAHDTTTGQGPAYILFDAQTPGRPGGTGQTANWAAIATARRDDRSTNWPPVLLAGGLTPDNVAEAIDAVHPTGVDVSSGVELENKPGSKDPAKVRAFIAAARGRTYSI